MVVGLGTLAVTTVLAGGTGLAQSRLSLDTPIARVGKVTITRKDLLEKVYRYYGKAAVEQLIDRTVLKMEAANYALQVTDADVSTRMAEVKKVADTRFGEALKAEGISEETWRDRARYVLLLEKTLDRKWPVKTQDLERLTVRYARLRTERQARDLVRDAGIARGANFPTLVLQRSEDKENAGVIQPEKFFKIDQPIFFRLATEAGLAVNQITRTPIESGGYFLVLRLEGRYPAETLSAREREAATQRIRAYRASSLIPTVRKRYRVETKTPTAALVESTTPSPDAELAVLTDPKGKKETLTVKDLNAHLLAYYGQIALDQLVQRQIISAAAQQARVAVTEADVTAFQNEAVKAVGKSTFQAAMDREGINETAWRDRTRYVLLAEKVLNAREPVQPQMLQRLTVRYIRVASQEQGQAALQSIQGGAKFEDVSRQVSLDRMGDGLLRPLRFFRPDNPVAFDAFKDLQQGQLLSKPIQLGGQWAVLRLEARFGPETLTAQERDSALRKINATRVDPLLESLRQEARPEILVPINTLITDARA